MRVRKQLSVTAEETEPDAVPAISANSKEQSDDYAELRKLISPTQTVQILDRFAIWLFSSTAIVGTLGAGFGATGLNHLGKDGKHLFALAVVCVSLSLALALLARIPFPLHVNRYSFDSLKAAHERAAKCRFWALLFAGLLFAVALILAGLSPIV
jgi:hypothetical protein